MRTLTVSMFAALGLMAALPSHPAHAAMAISPAAASIQAPDLSSRQAADGGQALVQPVDYYWHHRRWPYRWNGGYYRYRWGGGYYRYRRWRGGRWSYY